MLAVVLGPALAPDARPVAWLRHRAPPTISVSGTGIVTTVPHVADLHVGVPS